MRKVETINYKGLIFKYTHDTNDPSGYGCIHEIIKNDEYQLYRFKDISGTIIDIGGNHGLVSIILSLNNPNANIYILEPIPSLINIINENIKLNNCKNITVINKALGNGENTQLNISNQYSGASSTIVADSNNFSKKYNGFTSTMVETITFDNLLNEYNIENIELLKIDCEGGEYFLYDSIKFKEKIINNLVGEFHNLKYNLSMNANWNYNDLSDYVKQYISGFIKISYLSL